MDNKENLEEIKQNDIKEILEKEILPLEKHKNSNKNNKNNH